jgi:hypothetical protein
MGREAAVSLVKTVWDFFSGQVRGMRRAVKPKLLAIFVGLVSSGIVIIGYAFNEITFLFKELD